MGDADLRRTHCTRDCPDACGIVATVENGRIVRLQGDPGHPVTRGFLCYRTHRFLERQYAADRLIAPLVRRGGQLVPASWDEALDLVARTMLRIREESGPAAILHYRSGGSLGILKVLPDLLFERFGPCAMKSGDICSGAGEAAQELDFGVSDSNDLFDLLHARTIVLWGKNPYVSNLHLVPVLEDARARGARIVQIDPVWHRGAQRCDLYVQPRPGADAALALGVARRLFEDGRTDPHVAEYCDGVDAFRALAMSRSTAAWAETAGIVPEQLDELADVYGDGPSAILVGWGLQRRSRGGAAVRLLDALGAVSGNLGVPGGGVSFYFRRRSAFDASFVRGLAAAPRAIPEPTLGCGILEARDPEIRMVWVTAGNPVAMLPDSETVQRALASREMTVVVDSFLTDTARCATVVLPTTTMLEEHDLVGAYGHHWIGEVRPVVDPPAGARSDVDILRALAPRIGLDGELAADASEWQRRLLRKVSGRGASLADLSHGAVRNPDAPAVLFADRRFPTATGRVQLVGSVDADPPHPLAEYPLFLMALSTEKAQASQWHGPRQDGPAVATLHPEAAPGLRDGEPAVLESAHGAMTVRLRFDDRQRRDIVVVPKGGWLADGRCANALIPAQSTDLGGGAVYYETPVRVRAAND